MSLPLLALVMAGHFAGPALDALIAPRSVGWIQLILAMPAVLWGGWPFFQRGWTSLINRRRNMFTLIALGTGVAYLYSLVAALAPGIFPRSFRTPEGGVALYFEAAAVIVTLVLLGQVLELRARSQTSSSIRALLDLAPKHARLSVTTAPRRTSRSKRSWRASSCGSIPARRCRSMVSCSTGTAPSMSR